MHVSWYEASRLQKSIMPSVQKPKPKCKRDGRCTGKERVA
jgi:hypothetical protein